VVSGSHGVIRVTYNLVAGMEGNIWMTPSIPLVPMGNKLTIPIIIGNAKRVPILLEIMQVERMRSQFSSLPHACLGLGFLDWFSYVQMQVIMVEKASFDTSCPARLGLLAVFNRPSVSRLSLNRKLLSSLETLFSSRNWFVILLFLSAAIPTSY
jgi:hypothetical protein